MDLGDDSVEFGDVEGDGYLDGDGEGADGGNEDDGGAEGELDAEVEVSGCGCEGGGGEYRLVADGIRLLGHVLSRARDLQPEG